MAKQNILIVDDEPNLLESFKIGLELKDYIVSIASSGKKALVEIKDRSFDIVLLDIRVPEWTGLKHCPKSSDCGRSRSSSCSRVRAAWKVP